MVKIEFCSVQQKCVCARACVWKSLMRVFSALSMQTLSQQNSSKVLSLRCMRCNIRILMMYDSEKWLWIPRQDPRISLYGETFISPVSRTSQQRWLNNKHPRHHRLGHRSALKQVLLPPPLSHKSSGLPFSSSEEPSGWSNKRHWF